MKVSEASIEKLQLLLKDFFNANAKSDNIAYWLGYNYYNEIEAVYHAKWAHAFPSEKFADGLSNFMLKLDIRPVRYGLESHERDYDDLVAVFDDNLKMIKLLDEEVRDLIDVAELNNDVEVKLFAEELTLVLLDYVKQAEEWSQISKMTTPADMNVHIDHYTHFI